VNDGASSGSAVRTRPEWRASDLGNAEQLVFEHGRDLRFAVGLGWFAWDGRRWKRDADGEVLRRAKRTAKRVSVEAIEYDGSDRSARVRWALLSESESRLRGAVSLAESEREVLVEPDALDADPWLFNAGNGTIDLRSGELREHRREDLLTRITSVVYEPEAEADLWARFLATVTDGDEELAAFLARACGYSLTGHTSEEVLFFAHGPTATGKSSILEAFRGMFGEHGTTADFETFLRRRGDAGTRNDIARLAGARLVISVEVDDGKALAEGLLKLLTGGDTITARFLYREAFEFRPRFKLWLAANERPRVNSEDTAMWRRIRQLPFTHVIPEGERDERVKIELRSNPEVQSAILAWAVQGCLEWQRLGLKPPQRVLDYTEEYRQENDPLREWLADCCAVDPAGWTPTGVLRSSYEIWCAANGERPVSGKKLGTLLEARGFRAERETSGERGRRGLSLV
jgi:putative DNA primase/helicase